MSEPAIYQPPSLIVYHDTFLSPDNLPCEEWVSQSREWKRKNCISRDGIPFWEWPNQPKDWRVKMGLE